MNMVSLLCLKVRSLPFRNLSSPAPYMNRHAITTRRTPFSPVVLSLDIMKKPQSTLVVARRLVGATDDSDKEARLIGYLIEIVTFVYRFLS